MAVATGPKNAKTNENTGVRFYTWQGKQLPSVTSLRRLLGVPFPLANWMTEQVVKATMRSLTTLGQMAVQESEQAAEAWLRKEAMGERDTAANRGTAVHEAAATGRSPADTDLPIEVRSPLAQFYDFIQVTGALLILQEEQVFNLELGYAGSLDIGIELEWDGVRRHLVTDIKTGKGVYVDHVLQLMGYGLGEFVGKDDVVDKAATDWLHRADGLAILHLSDTSWELIEVQVSPEIYEVFKAMVRFAHWQIETPNIDTLVKARWSK